MKFQISLLLSLIFLVFVGCSVKSPPVVDLSKDKALIKAKQKNVSRLDYYQSMSAISKVTLQDLDAMIEGEPTAAGEVLVISAEATASAITEELMKSFSDSVDGSLPIVAHWNTGYPEYTNGMDPDYMLSLIENGLHVLPSWHLDPYWNDSVPESYYKASILKAAELNLPLVFISKPFEEALLEDESFSGKRASKNPAVINLDGDIVNQLSPFALDRQWYYAGKRWARSEILQKIQEWYPNPPLVMFVADKRVPKLTWSNAEESKRYMERYSSGKSEDFKREVIGSAWKEKYAQLQKGFKRALISVDWKANIKFVSYNEIPVEMGEYDEWKERATYTSERLSVWTDTADATTNQFHINTQNDEGVTDVHGVQSRANNIPFFYSETKGVNPSFAWQLSLSDSRLMASPEAYRGFTQLALWLTRPSVIRESINWSEDKSEIKPYFEQITDSVEMIYRNELLHKFWTKGKLVANPYYTGPNDDAIPSQYVNSKRWFVLNVDVNPSQPWNLGDYISVWAIALELGETPNREWLLYVQSPDGNQENISVEIPNYKDVIVDSSVEGAFYIIEESENQSDALARSIDTTTESSTQETTSTDSSSSASSSDESTPPDEILYTQTLLSNDLVNKDIPAFAGAEGPGANAIGGRGGRIIEVTNLNTSGPGSFREACEAKGPRIVVFKVSGTIDIGSYSLEISEPYLTIAGQTAPEGGITIRGSYIEILTHDVVVQYIKIRTGNREDVYADSLSVVDGAYNVIIDHCSLGWSNDENAEVWSRENPAHNITWSWNLLHEGLTGVEPWSMGLVTGSDVNVEDMRDITVQHNAFINFTHRTPLIKVKSAKVINNLIYNWTEWATGVSGGSTVDIIGNVYKAGPLTDSSLTYLREIVVRTAKIIAEEGGTGSPAWGPSGEPSIYIARNTSTRRNVSESDDDWSMVSEWYWEPEWIGLDASQYRRNEQMPRYQHPITQYDTVTAEKLVLANAGASKRINDQGEWIDNRDAIDTRLINEYQNGTGIIPASEDDVGGYLNIAQKEGYLDTDKDGMSDAWEALHGFNKYDAVDGGLDRDGDGYLNIEEFLNGTNP